MRVKSGNSSADKKRLRNLRYGSPQKSERRDTVRCSYCVSGLDFRAIVPHLDGRYICYKCGQTAHPGNTKYKCRCPYCLEVAALIASCALHHRNAPKAGNALAAFRPDV